MAVWYWPQDQDSFWLHILVNLDSISLWEWDTKSASSFYSHWLNDRESIRVFLYDPTFAKLLWNLNQKPIHSVLMRTFSIDCDRKPTWIFFFLYSLVFLGILISGCLLPPFPCPSPTILLTLSLPSPAFTFFCDNFILGKLSTHDGKYALQHRWSEFS